MNPGSNEGLNAALASFSARRAAIAATHNARNTADACTTVQAAPPVPPVTPPGGAAMVAAPGFPAYMGHLVARGAELLQAHFQNTGPVPFVVPAGLIESHCLALLEWPRNGERGPQVVILSARYGLRLCRSLPDDLYAIDTATVANSFLDVEGYGRGVDLLQAHFRSTGPVAFTWWADGEELQYLARLEWPCSEDNAPRVVVMYARSGQPVCMSLPGRPFEIDPTTVQVDYVTEDEIDRQAAKDNAARRRRAQ